MSRAIRGRQVQLFSNFFGNMETAPLAQDLSFTYNVSMIDGETKDDSIYQEPDPDGDTFTVEQSFICPDDDQSFIDSLQTSMQDCDDDSFEIATVINWDEEGLQDAAWQAGNVLCSGAAYITSVQQTGAVGSRATGSVTLTGKGEITIPE